MNDDLLRETRETLQIAREAITAKQQRIEGGGPAFPSHGSMGEVAQEGMTLRAYLAAHAPTLPSPVSRLFAEARALAKGKGIEADLNDYAHEAANWAVLYADAVIRRLEKR
jgi:hypothetical protein